jgi:hypothetical protein
MPAQCRASSWPTTTVSWPSDLRWRHDETTTRAGAKRVAELAHASRARAPAVARLPTAAQRRWRCGVSGTRTRGGPGACQTWRGGWTLTKAACRRGGGSVAEERRCSHYGGTPAGDDDLQVALRHGDAKGKLRWRLQGDAMAARAELTVRTSQQRCSSVIPVGRHVSVIGDR